MKKVLLPVIVLMFSYTAMGQTISAAGFYKRFTAIQNKSGKLDYIKDNSIKKGFSLKPLIDQIKSELLEAKAQSANESMALIDENFENASARTSASRALGALNAIDVEKIFNNSSFQSVMAHFEGKLAATLTTAPNVLAALNEPSFFYRMTVTQDIANWGINFAAKRLDNIPAIGIASYIILQAEKMIRNRRYFHQNMLLYYLEAVPPKDLGLTRDEVALITSSIYESRIPTLGYLNHTLARDQWPAFGALAYDSAYRQADQQLAASKEAYSKIGQRLDYAFQEVTEKGVHKIVNLVDKKHEYSNKPSIAYYYDDPSKVTRKRTLAHLIQIGIRFAPLSEWGVHQIEDFLVSSYANQSITEGSLAAYFESHDLPSEKKTVMAQTVNPFEVRD